MLTHCRLSSMSAANARTFGQLLMLRSRVVRLQRIVITPMSDVPNSFAGFESGSDEMKAWLMKGVPIPKGPVRPVFQENIMNDFAALPRTPYLPMGKEAPTCFSSPARPRSTVEGPLEQVEPVRAVVTLQPAPQRRRKLSHIQDTPKPE